MKMLLTLTLLTACIWLVGNLVLGALVAPGLFAHAPVDITRAQAGLLFGDLLTRWIAIVDLSLWMVLLVELALIAGYLLHLQRWGLMLCAVLALGGLTGVHLWARTTVREAGQQRPAALATGPAQILPDEQHVAFAAVHQRSETLFAAETLLLAAVVLVIAVASMVHQPGAAKETDT